MEEVYTGNKGGDFLSIFDTLARKIPDDVST
jgi:hypothetical protein